MWVTHEGNGACIAYYPSQGSSHGLPQGPTGLARTGHAVIFFEGDVPAGLGRDEAKLKAHLDRLRQALDHYARIYRVPYIFIARPGTFGSTGAHQERRGVREVHVLNAALDRIRARHRIERVTLTGQSGGATVAAALLTLGRTDVDCATPASGGYDLPGLLDWHAEKQGRDGSHRCFRPF